MRAENCGEAARMQPSHRGWLEISRKSLELGLILGLLIQGALAQKAPAPSPSPSPSPAPGPAPSPPPGNGPGNIPTAGMNANATLNQQNDQRVMFLRGRIVARDGSTVPHDMLIERICNERVRQQVYAGPHGDFSMQMGSRAGAIVDATADVQAQDVEYGNGATLGIPRRELQMCDLRATAAGFRSELVRLTGLQDTGGILDVGDIAVERMIKIDGRTISAAAYRAPNDARKAYEKGMSEARNGKYPEAQKQLEKAVQIYPKYASAWYELGVVRQKENDRDGARAAYTRAAELETKLLAPYLALAEMAYTGKDWQEVLRLTEHIIALDPMSRTNVTGYVLDLDPLNSGEAYFYNAMANFELGRIAEAEKSGAKAEHVDLMTKFPQLHLLMAEIYSRKKNYGAAIAEIETYLELVPGAKDLEPLKAQLAKLEALNGAAGPSKQE